MSQAERWIQRCFSRLRTGQRLEMLGDFLSAYLLVFGAIVLIVKLMSPAYWPQVLWLAVLAIPGAIIVCRRQRNLFTREESIAWLDSRLDCHGLLLTLSECPDSRWETQLPQLEKKWGDAVPQYYPTRFGRLVTVPALFLVVACLIPPRPILTAASTSISASVRVATELEGIVDSLEEKAALSKQEQEELKQEIERFREEARKGPLTHERWEIVDALRSKIQMKLDEASREVRSAREIAAKLSSEAERAGGIELTEKEREDLEDLLFETLQKLKDQGALDKIENQDLKEQMEQLARQEAGSGDEGADENGSKGIAGGGGKKPGEESQRLTKKKNNELKKKLSKDAQERRKQLESLRDFLEEQEDKLAECRGECQGGSCQGQGNAAGNGTVNRGRGDAELTFGEDSRIDDAKFKEILLPEGARDDPEAKTVGVSAAAPKEDPADAAPRNPLKKHDAATGDESWARSLSPRHRTVVRKYFDDKK